MIARKQTREETTGPGTETAKALDRIGGKGPKEGMGASGGTNWGSSGTKTDARRRHATRNR